MNPKKNNSTPEPRGPELEDVLTELVDSSKPLLTRHLPALSDLDRLYLKFAENFEERFVRQAESEDRSIEKTLAIGWSLLNSIPRQELKRIRVEYLDEYHGREPGAAE